MASTVSLSCRCGKVKGQLCDVTPGATNHVICDCKFCKALAHHLGHAGEVLDDKGGLRIFQLSPARIEITEGKGNLACLRMSSKGPLRWYTSCCNTAVSSSLGSGNLPFAGLVADFVRPALNETELTRTLGPVRARVNTKLKVPESSRWRIYLMFARFAGLMAIWKVRGDQRKSPFFDSSGKPVAKPSKLSDEERKAAFGGVDSRVRI